MKGWRTMLFAIIGGIISTLEGFDWIDILPDNLEAIAIPIIFAVFAYLRKITTTPLGNGEA